MGGNFFFLAQRKQTSNNVVDASAGTTSQFLSAFIRANQRQKISAKIYQFTKLPIYQLL